LRTLGFLEQSPPPKRFVFLRAFVLIVTALVAFAALVLPLALSPVALPLAVGDVAPRDLEAPYAVDYISEVRTENARQSAALTVAPVYTLADPSIARGQIESLRGVLLYINTIRADEYATIEEQTTDLLALEEIKLKEEISTTVLTLNDTQWETIQQEALSVLEQVMRNSIRQSDVASVQRSVPSRVSLALTETQAQLVSELARAFIIPNSLYSDDLTEAAQTSARGAVEPIAQSFKAGEMIVSGGQIITSENLEALETLGLIQSEEVWPIYLGAGVLTLTLSIFLWLYFSYRPTKLLNDMRSLISASIFFLIFLIGARLIIPNQAIIPYLYPLPAYGLLIATLFGIDAAFVLIFSLSLLTTYGLPNALDLTAYYLISSLISILILGKAQQVWSFLKAGLAVSMAGLAMLLVYWLPSTSTDWVGLATLAAAAAFSGIASASLTLLLQFSLAQILGLTTTLRLLEISRPDTPLLQFLLRTAPGTYQHSLQVANLAEQAAESIGADALLVRVGALFHDVGKTQNPLFFIENQVPGNINTHEDLAPEESAEIIIRHVTDGVALGRKYRLPNRLIDFMREHHGTNITRYQYAQALKDANGDVNKVELEKFRYPGPAPKSRETALLMLADGTEAWARADRPQSEEELRSLVHKMFESVQKSGQLNNTRLTLRDLSIIRESFVSTLRGTLHPRVKYPKERNTSASSGVPTIPREKME
jgi:cyclic-di-AMP phosphodiesterase PgpH